MALVQLNGGLWDTDAKAFVNPAEPPKQPDSAAKKEAVDNSTETPKKTAKKAKSKHGKRRLQSRFLIARTGAALCA